MLRLHSLRMRSWQSVPRREGRAKVTGQARYVDDSAARHAARRDGPQRRAARAHPGIDFDPAIPWDEFIIVTAADIPGANRVALILDDQPYLAADVINHPEEPVVLLAHRDRQRCSKRRAGTSRSTSSRSRRVFTIDEALAARARSIWGTDNIFKTYIVARGDVDAAFAARGASIVEGEYETGAQEQLYIEPNGMLAVGEPGPTA